MSSNRDSMVLQAQQLSPALTEWRRRIHARPELSFREFETSWMAADMLSEIKGMRVETGVGLETAVVGTLGSGEGPVIAIRADMDALSIREQNEVEYASVHEGVMHACGHDAHTAILLGAARLLGEAFASGACAGTVKFLFQPAEEDTDSNRLTGAPYMIQAGALDGADCVIALHVSPENPVGEIQVHAGYSMANVDVFEATINGTGGHGAYPHLGTDPVWMLAHVLQAIQGIVARRVSPLDPAVVSVCRIQAGTGSNIIPSQVYLQGTMRSYRPEVRQFLISELGNAFSVVEALGGSSTYDVTLGEPALYNDPRVTSFLKQTIEELYPDVRILDTPYGLGGEDFAHMAKKIPGAMIFLGCAVGDGRKRDLHTPVFDLDESCLPMGAAILAETAIRYLNGDYALQG